MAELTIDPRQVAEPSAPDLGVAGQVYENINKSIQKVGGAIGDIVQAKRVAEKKKADADRIIDEKSRIAGAKADLARLAVQYKNDRGLSGDSADQYAREASAIAQGWMQGADPESMKSLQTSLGSALSSNSNKILDAGLGRDLQREDTNLSLSVDDYTNTAAAEAAAGDYDGVQKTTADLGLLLEAMKANGASPREIIRAKENFKTVVTQADINAKLRNAPTQEDRVNVMKNALQLPESISNNKAISKAWSTFSKYTKLFAEGLDLSAPLKNMATDNSALNLNVPTKQADKLVEMTVKRDISGLNPDEQDFVQRVEAAQAEARSKTPQAEQPKKLPYQDTQAYAGQAPSYDFSETSQREQEGRPLKYYLADEYVRTEEAPAQREPTIQDYADAHVKVGSKNSTVFPQMLSRAMANGTGQSAFEATLAANYVYDKAGSTLELDAQTETVYTEMKLGIAQGRTDLDQLLKESRAIIARKSDADVKYNNDVFNSNYSLTGAGRKNLNEIFKDATGVEADKADANKSLMDFYHVLKKNYLAADGREQNAIDRTKRDMVRVHGQDMFSPFVGEESIFRTVRHNIPLLRQELEYTRLPPSVVMPYLNEKQINNQLTAQLVSFAERNKHVTVPDEYKKIKTADDFERMEESFTGLPEESLAANIAEAAFGGAANFITQNIDGVEVKGRVFLKSNSRTVQNNMGQPVWEVWMQDELGRVFPVRDDKSPINNTMLYKGQTPEQFAPEWAKAQDDEALEKNLSKRLSKEARQAFPRISLSAIPNYKKRKAYEKDLKNIERIQAKLKSVKEGDSND